MKFTQLYKKLLKEDISEVEVILQKNDETRKLMKEIKDFVKKIKKEYHAQYKKEMKAFRKLKHDEYVKATEPIEGWAKATSEMEVDSYVLNIQLEKEADLSRLMKKFGSRMDDLGLVEKF